MLKNLRKNKKGFTLIELIIVIVILVILVAIAVPAVSGQIAKANKSKVASNAKLAYNSICILIAEDIQAGNVLDTLDYYASICYKEAGTPPPSTTVTYVFTTGAALSKDGKITGGTFEYTEGSLTRVFTINDNQWSDK